MSTNLNLTYSSLNNNPLYQAIITAPDLESIYDNQDHRIILQLKLDGRDMIVGYSFIENGDKKWGAYASALGAFVLNRSIWEVSKIDKEMLHHYFDEDKEFSELQESGDLPLLCLPLLMLQKCLDKFVGRVKDLHALRGERSQDLVCHCFAVYKSELRSLFDEGLSFKSVQEAKLVGMGCGLCLSQVKSIQLEESFGLKDLEKKMLDDMETGRELKMTMGLNHQQASSRAYRILEGFLEANEIEDIVFLKVWDNTLYLKLINNDEKMSEKISTILINEFSHELIVKILS